MKTVALTYHSVSPLLVRRVTIAFGVLAIACMTSYVYFVNATIMRIVTWQKTEKEIAAIRPELGKLEASYLALERTVTMSKASELQFGSADSPEFISRKPLGKGLSLNNDL